MASKTWQVTANVLFPNQFPVEMVDGVPNPPQQLEANSRIPTQQRDLDGATAFIRPGDPQSVPGAENDIRVSVASLTIRMDSDAPSTTAAAETAIPHLDRLLESLSFQMQVPLHIDGLGVIDLTGPPAVGDMREMARWSGVSQAHIPAHFSADGIARRSADARPRNRSRSSRPQGEPRA